MAQQNPYLMERLSKMKEYYVEKQKREMIYAHIQGRSSLNNSRLSDSGQENQPKSVNRGGSAKPHLPKVTEESEGAFSDMKVNNLDMSNISVRSRSFEGDNSFNNRSGTKSELSETHFERDSIYAELQRRTLLLPKKKGKGGIRIKNMSSNAGSKKLKIVKETMEKF